jgi:hypothetical protein
MLAIYVQLFQGLVGFEVWDRNGHRAMGQAAVTANRCCQAVDDSSYISACRNSTKSNVEQQPSDRALEAST